MTIAHLFGTHLHLNHPSAAAPTLPLCDKHESRGHCTTKLNGSLTVATKLGAEANSASKAHPNIQPKMILLSWFPQGSVQEESESSTHSQGGMKVLGYSPEPQVGRPRQAVWLGVRVGKTGRFRQGFIVQKSFGHSHKTKQNKMPAALSYLLARKGTGKGPKTGCLQLPSQQSHFRGPEEGTDWLATGRARARQPAAAQADFGFHLLPP